MFRRLGFLCAALALFSMAGGHWAALQTVAWAQMLHDYSQRSGSLIVAVAQTFDGQHPCELCRAIAAAKSTPRDHAPAAPGLKKDDVQGKALLAGSMILSVTRTPVGPVAPYAELFFGPGRSDEPPTPPPRQTSRAA